METQSLIDEAIYDRRKTDSEIRKDAFKECFYLDDENIKKRRMCCKKCRYECFSCFTSIQTYKYIGLVFLAPAIWIVVIATAIVASYLYFNVISNIVALPFADTYCDNFIWQTCHTRLEISDTNVMFEVSLATFVGFIIHAPITLPMLISIFYYFDPDGCFWVNVLECMMLNFHAEPRTRRGNIKHVYRSLYVSWFFLCMYASIFASKLLTTNLFNACSDYKLYGLPIHPIMSEYPDWRRKIQNIGIGKGAKINQSLPGSPDQYDNCESGGFFLSLFFSAFLIPGLIYLIYLQMSRFKNIHNRLTESSQNSFINTNENTNEFLNKNVSNDLA